MAKRLYRSSGERLIGGVGGGLGEYFDIDPVWMRLAFVILAFANGLGLIAYLVLWIIVPRQASPAPSQEVVRQNIEEIKEKLREAEAGLRRTLSPSTGAQPPAGQATPAPEERGRPAYLVGLALVILGGVLLLSNLSVLRWFSWSRFWPILLVLAGVVVLLGRRGK